MTIKQLAGTLRADLNTVRKDKEALPLTLMLIVFELMGVAIGVQAFGPLLVLNIALVLYGAELRHEKSDKYRVLRLNLVLAFTAFALLVLRLALGI